MSHVDPSIVLQSGKSHVICPPAVQRNAGGVCRKRASIGLLGALFAAIMLGGAPSASALIFPTLSGTDCSASGGTKAQSGSPGALLDNVSTFTTGCGSQVQSNGTVLVPVTTDGGPNIYSFAQSATTQATAISTLGSVGALSSSASTSFPQSYLYTVNGAGGITENEYVASGNSSATAAWWDTLTIGGTPNANGFVVLQFSVDLSGSKSTSPIGATASIDARLFIDDDSRFNGQILGLSDPGTVSDTIGFRPGQQVTVYGDLMASTSSFAGRQYIQVCSFFCQTIRGDYVSASSATASALNTAGFRIDVVTPGGLYTSASGETYITSVPEPATAWFVGFGLLGLVGVVRLKARSGIERAPGSGH